MLAIIAPGQGAQTPAMLAPWLESAESAELVGQWSEVIGLDLRALGTTASADEIRDTANAQPLIVAAGVLGVMALIEESAEKDNFGFFEYVAGHSVGEITAAAIAGVMSFESALRLVRSRGIEMAKAASTGSAGMSAVLGGDREDVLAEIKKAGLVAANENGSGQIVAAGDLAALATLAPAGARVRALQVAGAFHTEFMSPAVEPLRIVASGIDVQTPIAGVISNRDGGVVRDGREVLDRIVTQIANPVRWDLCMAQLSLLGVTGVIEVPPAGTLVGLIKRAEPTIETFALKSPEDLELAREFVTRHQEG